MSWVEEPRLIFSFRSEPAAAAYGTVKLVALGHVTVGFNHDVAGSQACFRGGAVRFYRGNFNATGDELGRARAGVRGGCSSRSRPGSRGLPYPGDDLGGDALGVVGGNGERHTVGSAAVTGLPDPAR